MAQAMAPVTVNGVGIAWDAIAAEAQNHPADTADEAEQEAARALVIRELLLQEAGRQGIAGEPADLGGGRCESAEEAMVRALLEREVHVPQADEATCRRFHERHPGRFRTPDLFEPAHILIAADAADGPAHDRAMALARDLIAILEKEPQRFGDLARRHSDCSTAAQGGRLGQVERGQTTPEFETFLLDMEEGALCPVPVPTRYGVHVLRLDRRIAGSQLPYEAVRDRIAHYLQEASFRRGAAQYIAILAGAAEISGIALDGADSPLVQ